MHFRRIGIATLALSFATQFAWAIVTSDQPGSHVIAPGQTAFGLNLDGVVMVGGLLFGGKRSANSVTERATIRP
jgi:hypothetical protein